MPIDWKSAYAAALREQDPAKLPALCDQAREKINARILELAKETSTPRKEKARRSPPPASALRAEKNQATHRANPVIPVTATS